MTKLIAGNWKMNMDVVGAKALCADLAAAGDVPNADLLVCPAYVHIPLALDSGVQTGAQDCSALAGPGAHTGQVSASMLADIGCAYVIIGHSERRQDGERDSLIREKVSRAAEAGLTPILCVGEDEAQREAGEQEAIVGAQLKACIPDGIENLVIAYEPVWAIGTGKVAELADIEAMHGFMRSSLADLVTHAGAVRLLYGGSMKPGNAADILALANVDGGLIGGASLKAEDFLAIARAA